MIFVAFHAILSSVCIHAAATAWGSVLPLGHVFLAAIFGVCGPAPHAESSQDPWGLGLASGLPAKGMMTTISFQFNRTYFPRVGCRHARLDQILDGEERPN